MRTTVFLVPAMLIAFSMAATTAGAQTAFIYQGELEIQGSTAEGELDFVFALYDDAVGGVEVAAAILLEDVEARGGLFSAQLDFGPVFDGSPRWLEIRVKEAGAFGPFQTLSPRQPMRSAAGALFAAETEDTDQVDGQEAADLRIVGLELVGSELRITEGAMVFSQDLSTLIPDDADMDPENELNATLELNGTDLEVEDPGGSLSADLSPLQDGTTDADANPANETITSAALIAGSLLQLIENGTVTNLVDVTALLNSDLSFDGTDLTLGDGGGTLQADLSSLADGVDDADPDPGNELNTGVVLNGSAVEITDAGGTLSVDLAAFPVDDADADPVNESITDTFLTGDGGSLGIVEAGQTNLVPTVALRNSSITFNGTSLQVSDGAGTLSADISALAADADSDPANELNTALELNGTSVEVSDAGGTLSADLAAFPVDDADPDPANERISALTLTNTSLQIVEAEVTNAVDVATLQTTGLSFDGTSLQVSDGGGTLQADISALGDDADANPLGELNSSLVLNGSDLELTDAAGTLVADLSSLQDGNVDADADPANELISDVILAGDTLEIVEAGVTNSLSLAALENSALTFDGTSLSVTDGGGSVSADLSSLGDDADSDPANELNTGLVLDGTDLEVTDVGGTLQADLSGLQDGTSDADDDATSELIETAFLTNGAGTLAIVEGGLSNQVAVASLGNESLTFDGTTLTLTDGGGTVTADLSSLDDANTAFGLSGTDLQVTDSGGTLSANISSIDGSTDADTQPGNELLTNAVLNGSVLELHEGGSVVTTDLSSLIKSSSSSLYERFGWTGDSAPEGTNTSSANSQKVLELVEQATSNAFEVDFNRIKPGTIITNIPFTISEDGGFYYLIQSLTNSVSASDGIIINANDITLDLMGYSLVGHKHTSLSAMSDDGIIVLGSRTNIKIRNGVISGWGGDGINARNAKFSIFKDVRVSQNDENGLIGDLNCVMDRVTAFSNGTDGIVGDAGTVIANSSAGQNAQNGFEVGAGCVVTRSASFDNMRDGFDLGASSVISESTATDNGLAGFDMDTGANALRCIAYDNLSNGFDMASSCLVRGCIASLNNGHGFHAVGSARLNKNKSHENDLDGIRIIGSGSLLIGNQVTDNDKTGINVLSSGCLVVQNTAAGNVTNYNVVTNSAFGPIVNVTGAGDITGIAGADHPWANFEF